MTGIRTRPLRYPLAEAAELLRVGKTSLRNLMKAGEFTVIPGPAAGRGVRQYIPADEVEVFGLRGLDGLREYRARKRRAK